MSSISVIIPAYNAEKYIGEAIESVLNQTRPAKEIIIVDDASTDRTVEIARSYGDHVTVLVNEVNSGPGHSRNVGVAHSTGDYLAFLDADDKWMPEHLSVLAGILDAEPKVALATSRAQQIGLETSICPDPLPVPPDRPADCFLALMRNYFTPPSGWLLRRRMFQEIGGFQEMAEFWRGRRIQAEDFDFLIRLSYRHRIYSTSGATCCWRRYAEQSTAIRERQAIQAFKYRIRMLQNMGTANDRYAVAAERMVRHWECIMEGEWSQRRLADLRVYVAFGRRQPLLRMATAPYMAKAWIPQWLANLFDSLYGSGAGH